MRRFFILFFLLSSLSLSAQYKGGVLGELDDSPVAAALRRHTGYLASAALEGRQAGSAGEADAAAYLEEMFDSYGIERLYAAGGDVFGMKLPGGDTLTSRNVAAFVPGYDKSLKDHYIVIGARLDNLGSYGINIDGQSHQKIYYGANGNASGLSILIELARMLSSNSIMLKRTVILAGFGASLKDNAGSWYFLNRSFGDVDKIDAMINLDMLGTGSRGLYAYTASNPDLNILLEKLANSLQPIHPEVVTLEPCASDHRSFYNKEIPSVMFTTGMYPEYNTEKDTPSVLEYSEMERELEFIYNFTVALAGAPKPLFNPSGELRKRVDDGSVDVVPYYDCDVRPSFLGSSDPEAFLNKWVYTYLRYPREAVEHGIQGRVLVSFVIDEKGNVRDVKVLRGVDPMLDDEAVRVISAANGWRPGRLRGKKVKCGMSLYVEFRLEKKKKK